MIKDDINFNSVYFEQDTRNAETLYRKNLDTLEAMKDCDILHYRGDQEKEVDYLQVPINKKKKMMSSDLYKMWPALLPSAMTSLQLY